MNVKRTPTTGSFYILCNKFVLIFFVIDDLHIGHISISVLYFGEFFQSTVYVCGWDHSVNIIIISTKCKCSEHWRRL